MPDQTMSETVELVATSPRQPRLAYSPESAAEFSDLGRTKIFQDIKEGRLRARKAGSRTIILHEDLVDYLRSLPAREVEPANAPATA